MRERLPVILLVLLVVVGGAAAADYFKFHKFLHKDAITTLDASATNPCPPDARDTSTVPAAGGVATTPTDPAAGGAPTDPNAGAGAPGAPTDPNAVPGAAGGQGGSLLAEDAPAAGTDPNTGAATGAPADPSATAGTPTDPGAAPGTSPSPSAPTDGTAPTDPSVGAVPDCDPGPTGTAPTGAAGTGAPGAGTPATGAPGVAGGTPPAAFDPKALGTGTATGNNAVAVALATTIAAIGTKAQLQFQVEANLVPGAGGTVPPKGKAARAYRPTVQAAAIRIKLGDDASQQQWSSATKAVKLQLVTSFQGLVHRQLPKATRSITVVGSDDRLLASSDASAAGKPITKLY